MTSEWLVVRRRPRVRQIALVAALVLSGAALYELGRYQAGYDWLTAGARRAAVANEIAELRAHNQALRAQVAALEATREVDRQVYREVESSLGDLQEQLLSKERELQFYQGIVSPEDRLPGLRIHRFELVEHHESRFQLRLVLVQALSQEERISGDVHVTLHGERDGEALRLALADLVPDDEENGNLSFSFRYFQEIIGELEVPGDVTPESVDIELVPAEGDGVPLRESFDWPASVRQEEVG